MSNLEEEKTINTSSGKVSRRKFLKYAAGGITGAALLGFHGHSLLEDNDPELSPTENLEQLHKQNFLEFETATFTVKSGALETVNIHLISVEDKKINYPERTGEIFSLLFTGPTSSPLEQGTYMLENTSTGTFPLFMVPVINENDNIVYEAVFNRL